MSIRLLSLALMVVCVSGGVAGAADDQAAVKQTVLTYIRATAEGDFETREKLSTGMAEYYNARPGTARFKFHQAFARTFLGLGRIEFKKGLATVLVRFDAKDLARLMRRAARARLRKLQPDPKTRRKMARHIQKWAPLQARRMSCLRVWLVKKDGHWLILRFSSATRSR